MTMERRARRRRRRRRRRRSRVFLLLCRRRAIPKSWSRLEKKSAVLFRRIIAGMMVLLFANEREGRKSSIFPPMSAEATAVHPATQITHDDDVNTKLENSDNVFLRRKAKPDAAFEEKIDEEYSQQLNEKKIQRRRRRRHRKRRRRTHTEAIVHLTCI